MAGCTGIKTLGLTTVGDCSDLVMTDPCGLLATTKNKDKGVGWVEAIAETHQNQAYTGIMPNKVPYPSIKSISSQRPHLRL
jgi:hypothetical protein